MTTTATPYVSLSSSEKSAVEALLYFDLFNYPLTEKEVRLYSNVHVSATETDDVIRGLLQRKLIYQTGNFYSAYSKEGLNKKREEGNKRATDLLKKAKTYARLIQRFPFVRCVCISGSLSKGCVDESGDIDYFIITKPERLWIARTLLVLFKKVVLLNRHKYFCVNYFVDTNHLEIPDKNVFTATEIATLLPMTGAQLFEQFHEENDWYKKFLPNMVMRETSDVSEPKGIVKPIVERILNGGLGKTLDTWFMQLTMKRWRKKFNYFSDEELDIALRSRKYVSKHHPQNFQQRVLKRLEENKLRYEQLNQVKLHG
jgi:hypothetical protein